MLHQVFDLPELAPTRVTFVSFKHRDYLFSLSVNSCRYCYYYCYSVDPSIFYRDCRLFAMSAWGDNKTFQAYGCRWRKSLPFCYNLYPFFDSMTCTTVYLTPFPIAIVACIGPDLQ